MFEMLNQKPFQNIQKFKTSKSEISKTWRETEENTLDTMIQTVIILQLTIIINIVVNSFNIIVSFLTII